MQDDVELMQIKTHQKGYSVELQDGSRWCIWPPDMCGILQWSPYRSPRDGDRRQLLHARAHRPRWRACPRHQRGCGLDPETNAWLSDRGRVRSTPFQGELSPPPFEEPLEALAVDDVYPVRHQDEHREVDEKTDLGGQFASHEGHRAKCSESRHNGWQPGSKFCLEVMFTCHGQGSPLVLPGRRELI